MWNSSISSIHRETKMWNKIFVTILFVTLSTNTLADPPLVGRWVEDETLRTGLYDFLWARGKRAILEWLLR